MDRFRDVVLGSVLGDVGLGDLRIVGFKLLRVHGPKPLDIAMGPI